MANNYPEILGMSFTLAIGSRTRLAPESKATCKESTVLTTEITSLPSFMLHHTTICDR
jgi:hypothetical protein